MNSNELEALLAMLRKYGVQSAEVPLTAGCVLRVVFEPDMPGPLPGDQPTPGGWKGPDRLDAPLQFDAVP